MNHHISTVVFLLACYTPVSRAATADSVSRPNIVVLVADDLRRDALGVFGGSVVKTPHLDRLANRGAVFTRATCSYPICNVSRTEMFAGRLMMSAELARGPGGGLKFDSAWTLYPARFRDAGWHTVYSGKWHVSGSPWAAGFAETRGLYSSGGAPAGTRATNPVTPTGRKVTGYSGWTFKNERGEPLLQHGIGLTPETDRIMTDYAVEAIRQKGGKPLFLQVNFTAPHDPLHWPAGDENGLDYRKLTVPSNFQPGPEFDTGNVNGRDESSVPAPRTEDDVGKERAIYFMQVRNVDRQVGRIIEALEAVGELERTIIIFTADHGLALGSHGLMGKQNQYEHTINVPLVIAGPRVPPGKRFEAQCYLRDLYPTMCDLAGLTTPASVQARSLWPVIRGDEAEVHDAIFGYFTNTQRMIRQSDGWKLIWYPKIAKVQLFQVRTDPDELSDLSADPAHTGRLQLMKAELARWQQQHQDPILVLAP